jgi:hypothetical protein
VLPDALVARYRLQRAYAVTVNVPVSETPVATAMPVQVSVALG